MLLLILGHLKYFLNYFFMFVQKTLAVVLEFLKHLNTLPDHNPLNTDKRPIVADFHSLRSPYPTWEEFFVTVSTLTAILLLIYGTLDLR